MKSDIILFWADSNWQQYGEAFNLWLQIDYDSKYAKIYTSSYSDNTSNKVIEVTRRTDIITYAKYLKSIGFNVQSKVMKRTKNQGVIFEEI